MKQSSGLSLGTDPVSLSSAKHRQFPPESFAWKLSESRACDVGDFVQCLSQMEIIQTPILHLPDGCPNHRSRNEEPLSSLMHLPAMLGCIKASPHLSPWRATTATRLCSTVWQDAEILRFRFTNAFSGFSMLPRNLGDWFPQVLGYH